MKRIVKPKRLDENLAEMRIGDTAEIYIRDYKPAVVRSTIYRLNNKGFMFKATEKGLIDSIKVIRLK